MQKTLLNLNRKYLELASLEFHHDYYNSKVVPSLKFIPSASTASFLRNYKLLAKQVDSKMIILQEGKYYQDNWIPKIKVDQNFKLNFALKFNDELFQIKTNVEMHANKDFKFFINQSLENKSVKVEKLGILPFYSGEFPKDLVSQKKISKLYFFEKELKDFSEHQSLEMQPGIYKIEYFDQSQFSFIWNYNDNNFDGFVTFDISQQLNQHYNILFSSREIFWEYILIPKYIDNVMECKIVDDLQNLEFEAVENESLQTKDFSLKSTLPIKLMENYNFNLKLEKHGEKLINLPFPSLKNITLEKDNVKKRVNKYFLSTYVNL